jgi:hypothetical protein
LSVNGSAMERNFMTDDDRLRSRALSDAEVEQFIRDGFIRIDRAFPQDLAEQGCTIMWRPELTSLDCHHRANMGGQTRRSLP